MWGQTRVSSNLTRSVMDKYQLQHLLLCMVEDKMSSFWVDLVRRQGPRGRLVAENLWKTIPPRYHRYKSPLNVKGFTHGQEAC